MKTSERVLIELEKNRGNYVSGQSLAEMLNMTRTAIWKGVKKLQQEGYLIEAYTNRGYRLSGECTKMSAPGIISGLDEDIKDVDVYVYTTVDSTNTELKRLKLIKALKNFSLVVANEQTKGRGRRGKTFYSPKDCGLYLSIFLKPEKYKKIEDFELLTIKAAVAVCKTIEELTDLKPEVKWVNDIYLDGKKLCGILTEMDADFESRTVNSAIVGIGINLKKPPVMDKEIADIACYLDRDIAKNEFISRLLNNFKNIMLDISSEKILDEYRNRLMLTGREISYMKNDKSYIAKVLGINEKGNLIVEIDGNKELLTSGEVELIRRR